MADGRSSGKTLWYLPDPSSAENLHYASTRRARALGEVPVVALESSNIKHYKPCLAKGCC